MFQFLSFLIYVIFIIYLARLCSLEDSAGAVSLDSFSILITKLCFISNDLRNFLSKLNIFILPVLLFCFLSLRNYLSNSKRLSVLIGTIFICSGLYCYFSWYKYFCVLFLLLGGFLTGYDDAHDCKSNHRITNLCFFSIICIATILRFYDLQNVLPGFSGHSIGEQLDVRLTFFDEVIPNLLAGERPKKDFFAMLFAQETAPTGFLEAVGFYVYGFGFMQMKLFATIVGCMTIYVAFIFGKKFHSEESGLIFSFLLSISVWHLTASRYLNGEHIVAPLHFLLSTICAHNVLNKRRWLDFIFLGFLTGLAIYIYATNQVLSYATVGILLILCLIPKFNISRSDKSVIKLFSKFFVLLVIAGLISFPQLQYYFSAGHYLPIRKNGYNDPMYHIASLTEFLQNLKAIFNEYFVATLDPWFTSPAGILTSLEKIIVPIGLGIFISLIFTSYRKLKAENILLFLLLIFSLIPALLSPAACFRRSMIFIVILTFFASFPLMKIIPKSKNRLINLSFLSLIFIGGVAFLSESTNRIMNEVETWESGSEKQNLSVTKTAKIYRDNGYQTAIFTFNPTEIPKFEGFLKVALHNNPILENAEQIQEPVHVISPKDIDHFLNDDKKKIAIVATVFDQSQLMALAESMQKIKDFINVAKIHEIKNRKDEVMSFVYIRDS